MSFTFYCFLFNTNLLVTLTTSVALTGTFLLNHFMSYSKKVNNKEEEMLKKKNCITNSKD